ncbi:MAG: deoxyhypusine synthase [Alistipes indistinctus]
MNLVAHSHYKRVPNYRDFTPQDEWNLLQRSHEPRDGYLYSRRRGFPPPAAAYFQNLERRRQQGRALPALSSLWHKLLRSQGTGAVLRDRPEEQLDAGRLRKNIPIIVPGWEDSTMGNIFTRLSLSKGELEAFRRQGGIETMIFLAEWYRANSGGFPGVGFSRSAAASPGDFPVCVVPMMYQDLEWDETPLLGLFLPDFGFDHLLRFLFRCSTQRKITWGKLLPDTPSFIVALESDATIVAPLIFMPTYWASSIAGTNRY